MDISASSINSLNLASGYKKAEENTNLSMNDFFELLVAELQNQSMLDPVDSSEFIGQMAQFTTLSQMKELASVSQMSYAVSLLGKTATVLTPDSNGTIKTVTGIVDNIAYENGSPCIEIAGVQYSLGALQEVKAEVKATDGKA